MVIAPYTHTEWEKVETLDETERGDGGFSVLQVKSLIMMKSSLSHHDNADRNNHRPIYRCASSALLPWISLCSLYQDSRKFDYFYEGLKLKEAGKYDAAFDAFNHNLPWNSTASSVLYELSSFYVQLNHPETAVGLSAQSCEPLQEQFGIIRWLLLP